jgi:hypothetical protein
VQPQAIQGSTRGVLRLILREGYAGLVLRLIHRPSRWTRPGSVRQCVASVRRDLAAHSGQLHDQRWRRLPA